MVRGTPIFFFSFLLSELFGYREEKKKQRSNLAWGAQKLPFAPGATNHRSATVDKFPQKL